MSRINWLFLAQYVALFSHDFIRSLSFVSKYTQLWLKVKGKCSYFFMAKV